MFSSANLKASTTADYMKRILISSLCYTWEMSSKYLTSSDVYGWAFLTLKPWTDKKLIKLVEFFCYAHYVAKASSIETGSGDLILNLRNWIGVFLFSWTLRSLNPSIRLAFNPNNFTEKFINRSSLTSNISPTYLIVSRVIPASR